ncbi:hypothetical protein [Roseateles chitinivorans]|uniref:hypothetical protein n=1 Tax=Roseateles chitinivorans TaxID=2917965 RepID=UPI003D6717F7
MLAVDAINGSIQALGTFAEIVRSQIARQLGTHRAGAIGARVFMPTKKSLGIGSREPRRQSLDDLDHLALRLGQFLRLLGLDLLGSLLGLVLGLRLGRRMAHLCKSRIGRRLGCLRLSASRVGMGLRE